MNKKTLDVMSRSGLVLGPYPRSGLVLSPDLGIKTSPDLGIAPCLVPDLFCREQKQVRIYQCRHGTGPRFFLFCVWLCGWILFSAREYASVAHLVPCVA